MGAVQIAFDFGAARSRALPDVEAETARLSRKLELRLSELLGAVVDLTLTDNSRTMVSARERQGVTHVRLHNMFVGADDITLRAIARFLADGHGPASAQLQRYIEQHRERIRRAQRVHEPAQAHGDGAKAPSATTTTTTRTRTGTNGREGNGAHYDLQAVFDRLNVAYFEGRISARIDWARKSRGNGRRRRRRSIKLGSYRGRGPLIRVHPVLDATWVPAFFVEYIVYHEMLHHVVPMPVHNGKRRLHGQEFKSRERLFVRYDDALAWERANLDRLLSG